MTFDLNKPIQTSGEAETEHQRKRWEWLLIKVQDIDLNDREEKFVRDLTLKHDRQGAAFRLTEAQEDWLEAICARGG